eukprot:8350906-Pyramimonas_sp.AAC.1
MLSRHRHHRCHHAPPCPPCLIHSPPRYHRPPLFATPALPNGRGSAGVDESGRRYPIHPASQSMDQADG